MPSGPRAPQRSPPSSRRRTRSPTSSAPRECLLFLSAPTDTPHTLCSLASNELCGIDSRGNGTYTVEGITKLCEALKGSAVTLLKCATSQSFFSSKRFLHSLAKQTHALSQFPSYAMLPYGFSCPLCAAWRPPLLLDGWVARAPAPTLLPCGLPVAACSSTPSSTRPSGP